MRLPPSSKPAPAPETSRSRAATALELARRHPEFAKLCSDRLDPETRQEFIRALAARRPPLRPIKKAGPERYRPTALSVQLERFAKLTGN